jgi:hypothetical protein
MKTTILKLAAILLLLAGMVSCRDNETNPLKDIRWKLTTFVDENGITREPEPDSNDCYTITFHSNNTFSGVSSTNAIQGNYTIDFKNSTFRVNNVSGTKINELFDGNLYVDKLMQVLTFSLIGKELTLYCNDKNNYLIFISI